MYKLKRTGSKIGRNDVYNVIKKEEIVGQVIHARGNDTYVYTREIDNPLSIYDKGRPLSKAPKYISSVLAER